MLFCRNKDCFGPAHSGALCPACAEDEAHSSPLISSKEAKKQGSAMDTIRALGDRLMGHDAAMAASFDRIGERVTTLLAENETLRAEVADLRRANEALKRQKAPWGWNRMEPEEDPDGRGGFFNIPASVVGRMIRAYHHSQFGTDLQGFGFRVDQHGSIKVRF